MVWAQNDKFIAANAVSQTFRKIFPDGIRNHAQHLISSLMAQMVIHFMKSYHIHVNTGQPFIPCSLKHTDIPFILSPIIQARQRINVIIIRCFLMALKKFQFLFIKIYRLIIVRIFFPILIFQRNFYLQILTYERIFQTLFLHIFRHYLQCTFYVAAFFTYYFHSISPCELLGN